jgi:hypothetical protein
LFERTLVSKKSVRQKAVENEPQKLRDTSASSTYTGTVASATINGDRKGLNYGQNGSWGSNGAGYE